MLVFQTRLFKLIYEIFLRDIKWVQIFFHKMLRNNWCARLSLIKSRNLQRNLRDFLCRQHFVRLK